MLLNRSISLLNSIVSLIAMSLILSGSLAFNNLQAQPAQNSCKDDAARLCKGVKPGEGRIRKCLKENEASLSAACQDRLASWDETRAGIRNACRLDYMKYCKGQKGKKAISCLRSQTDLSAGCKEVLESAPGS